MSLLRQTAWGAWWMGSAQVLSQVLHLATRLILARILAPADFGLVSMAMVFISLSSLGLDMGMGAALIQRPTLTEADRSTSFWSSLALGALLCLSLVIASPWVASFYRAPALTGVLRGMSLTLLFSAPESVYGALLQREMNFRALGLRRLGAIAVGGTVGVASALMGAGVWALVADSIVRGLVGSVLLIATYRWIPSLSWSRSSFRELWSFSRHVVGARAVNFLNRNADNLLIGRYLGAGPLGLYSFAYQAVLLPLQYLARPLVAVGFPALASIHTDLPRCRRAFFRSFGLLVLVTWPFAGLAAVASPSAVPLVLGDRWSEAIPAFQILSLVALLHAPASLSPAIFDGLGRPDLGLKFLLLALAANLFGFTAGLKWGITGVAIGYLCANLATIPIHYRFVLGLLEAPAAPLIDIFARGALCLASLGATWFLLTSLIQPGADLWRLALGCTASLAAYAATSRLALPDAWRLASQSLRQLAVR